MLIVFSIDTLAQCPMCKAALESNRENVSEKKVGNGINKGILYLLAIPYIAGVTIAGAWYWNKKKQS